MSAEGCVCVCGGGMMSTIVSASSSVSAGVSVSVTKKKGDSAITGDDQCDQANCKQRG